MKKDVTGCITRDAISIKNDKGNYVLFFSVAVNDRYYTKAKGEYEETDFIDCSMLASPKLADSLVKGRIVSLHGNLKPDVYFKKDDKKKKNPVPSFRLFVNEIKWEGYRSSGSPKDSSAQQNPAPAGSAASGSGDDLPF
ncbi:single-stranded DNA-binding protein [Chitinophaga sp. NPDC101104]|uniref:single-stranded DNA-binding protein n=1 Tax=Chitinophaga sp. NPDC101104 TaxID=3390561 RepID=UPI003D08E126